MDRDHHRGGVRLVGGLYGLLRDQRGDPPIMRIYRGITRTVLVTDQYAIKLPSLRRYGNGLAGLLWSLCRGILANQSEAEWYRQACPDMKRDLCPVLRSWIGGLINVYPACRPFRVPRGVRKAMSSRRFFPCPMLFPQVSDNKPENYGWLPDGRVVVLDYDMGWNGCPHDRSGHVNRSQEDPHVRPF